MSKALLNRLSALEKKLVPETGLRVVLCKPGDEEMPMPTMGKGILRVELMDTGSIPITYVESVSLVYE